MASETSGDCVGVCEHPTGIPTTSSASEAKHTGKVLILDLLITITDQAVVIECTLYCRTLLPNYSQSTSDRNGHRSSLGLEVRRLRLSLPTAPIQRLHYSEAQAQGRRAAKYVWAAALARSGARFVQFNASLALPAPTGRSPAPAAQ